MKHGNKLEYINSIKKIISDKYAEIDFVYNKMLTTIDIEKESREEEFLFDYIHNNFSSPTCEEILKSLDTEF